jgi:Protein of unknown function (DUF3137).
MNSTEIQNNRTDDDILAEMESLRKNVRTVKQLSLALFVLFPIFFLWVFFSGSIFMLGFNTFFIIAVGLMGVYAVFQMWHSYLLKKYKSYAGSFKSIVVKTELEKVFDNLIYEPDSGWPSSVIQDLRLFKSFNVYITNDRIKAEYKNVSFEQADIKLIDEHEESYRDANGDWRTRKVQTIHFSGRMIKFNYDSYFPSDLRIVGKYFSGVSPSNWESIDTASIDFNKKFHSSASDKPASLMILKPQLIIKILDFYEWFGQSFAFYFKDNNLFVFLPGKETFELSDKKLETQRKTVLADIELLIRSLDATVDIADDFIDSAVMVKK